MAECTQVLAQMYVFKQTTFSDTYIFKASSYKTYNSPSVFFIFEKRKNHVENVHVEMYGSADTVLRFCLKKRRGGCSESDVSLYESNGKQDLQGRRAERPKEGVPRKRL